MIDEIIKWLNPFAALALGGAITYNFGYCYPSGIPFDFLTFTDITFSIIFLLPFAFCALFVYYLYSYDKHKFISSLFAKLHSIGIGKYAPRYASWIDLAINVTIVIIGTLLILHFLYFVNIDPNIFFYLLAPVFVASIIDEFLPRANISNDKAKATRKHIMGSAYFIMVALFGYTNSYLNFKKVQIELNDSTLYEGLLFRSLERGGLIRTDTETVDLIPWSSIKRIKVEAPLNYIPEEAYELL